MNGVSIQLPPLPPPVPVVAAPSPITLPLKSSPVPMAQPKASPQGDDWVKASKKKQVINFSNDLDNQSYRL